MSQLKDQTLQVLQISLLCTCYWRSKDHRNNLIIRSHFARLKVCNESWEAQLTCLDSWVLTAWILLNKVLVFTLVKGPYYDFKLCSF